MPLTNVMTSKRLRDTTNGANVMDAMSHHDNVVLKDMLKHSLEEVYKQLEELRQNNAAQFREIIEKNNEKCKESEKIIRHEKRYEAQNC